MIDDNVLKSLIALHRRASDLPACSVIKGIAYVHSTVFVLELPEKEVQLKKQKWPGQPLPLIETWREQLPADPRFVKAMVSSETMPSGEVVQQLTAFSGDDSRYMQDGFYEFFREQLDNPVFKIMCASVKPGEPGGIGIFVDNKLVSAAGAYLPPAKL